MAELITFRTALERCGMIQEAARDAFVDQGYSNMRDMARLSDSRIQETVKTVNRLPAPAAGPRPAIPSASIEKLQAMREPWIHPWERFAAARPL